VGHVVHSGASGVRKVNALFFVLTWAGAVNLKSTPGHITLCVFAFGEICGSRSAFRCIRTQNINALFFMIGWAHSGFHRKHVGTRYAELVFFHPI
jgi:hypothetical protein